MGYKYKINMGYDIIDLDEMMDILGGDKCSSDEGRDELRRQLKYYFGDGGYKFIVDTLQEQVDNIKARQPSEE